jgi:hypothetical protein
LDIDMALTSIENYRKYLEELEDVNDDELYRIDVYFSDRVEQHLLVMEDNYDDAIATFDAKYMMEHMRDGEPGQKIVLWSPVTPNGERVALSGFAISEDLTNG